MIKIFSVLAATLLMSACANQIAAPTATANLQATKGNNAAGVVTFSQGNGRVLVSGEIKGLKPNAEHAFHVHEKGDCSSGDGMSTGGHFNPTSKPHGAHGDMGSDMHHTGDLPVLKTDANGTVKFNFESTSITVGSGTTNVVGRGLIVHRDPDDYKTQPTGNAGPRIACAVITLN